MDKSSKIYIAGHKGLVGSAILRNLSNNGYKNLIVKTHKELDLINQKEVEYFFEKYRPEYVFLAAAKVGGIYANSQYPAEFIYQNIMIESNIIHAAYQYKVEKLLFLGSSCIYPKHCPQPIKEEYLLSSELEPTNEAYAIAKIAGLKMCQYYNQQYGTKFISVMPTNLYGPNDNFNLETSHVLPALIRKFHEAKMENRPYVEVWGDGTPLREFLYVDDLAHACVFLIENYVGNEIINIGTGKDTTIKQLAEYIKTVVNYEGEIIWDTTKPNGTPRKLLDVSKLSQIGWKHHINIEEGIKKTYKWYKKYIERGNS